MLRENTRLQGESLFAKAALSWVLRLLETQVHDPLLILSPEENSDKHTAQCCHSNALALRFQSLNDFPIQSKRPPHTPKPSAA